MASVQQAVLEFDGEVQAPWRPRLVPAPELRDGRAGTAARGAVPRPHPSRRSALRVGVCGPRRPGPPQGRPAGRGAPHEAASPRSPATTVPGRERSVRPLRVRLSPVRRAGLRLTRRAHRLAVVLALVAGVALGSWLDPALGGGDEVRLAGAGSVVVQPGDTVWSIARSLDGDGDVRAVVDEIERLNDLRAARLEPGQVLRLP